MAVWHLDVEGAEAVALRSAAATLDEGRVRNAFIEVTPDRWAAYEHRRRAHREPRTQDAMHARARALPHKRFS